MKGNAESWNALCHEFSKRIRELDDVTPWQEREPEWWLHMMEIERQLTPRALLHSKEKGK